MVLALFLAPPEIVCPKFQLKGFGSAWPFSLAGHKGFKQRSSSQGRLPRPSFAGPQSSNLAGPAQGRTKPGQRNPASRQGTTGGIRGRFPPWAQDQGGRKKSSPGPAQPGPGSSGPANALTQNKVIWPFALNATRVPPLPRGRQTMGPLPQPSNHQGLGQYQGPRHGKLRQHGRTGHAPPSAQGRASATWCDHHWPLGCANGSQQFIAAVFQHVTAHALTQYHCLVGRSFLDMLYRLTAI